MRQSSNCYLVLRISFRNGPRRKHRSFVAVQLLLSDGMMYSTAACKVIGTDCAVNTVSLFLFMGRCLVTAGSSDAMILALSEYATISSTTANWLPTNYVTYRTYKNIKEKRHRA